MDDGEHSILEEQFALYPGKVKYDITLTNRRFFIKLSSNGGRNKNEDIILLDDVTGCHVLQASKDTISSAYLCVYSYPLRKKRLGSTFARQRVTKTFTIDCNKTYQENLVVAEQWKMTVKRLLIGEDIRTREDIENGSLATRNLLVLVNPFSGRKKAVTIYKEKVRPMFLEAEIKHTVRNTTHSGHAKDIAKQLKLEDWDGIVIVSGDGLVHEIINGLMDRPDWEDAIKMPIGIVPGGSGNALAASLVYASTGLHNVAASPISCTFEICRGYVRSMDVIAMETKDPGGVDNVAFGSGEISRNITYSFLGITLGLIADIDIESELFRCLGGELRTAIYALIRILFLRKYDMEVSYLPWKKSKNFSSGDGHIQAWDGSGDTDGNLNNKVPMQNCVTVDKEVPDNWITVDDRFVLVMAISISHLATDALFNQQCQFHDGKIYLSLHEGTTTRKECMKAWSLMEEGSGLYNEKDASKCSGKMIECSAFRITPKGRSQIITADGEVIPFGPIQCSIMPGLARVMSSIQE